MAVELAPLPIHLASDRWTTEQRRAQFGAIAWLRWRILINSFRRKGSKAELIGLILVYPLFGFLILALVVGAGIGAWAMAANNHMQWISPLLWGIFVLCQLLNIQLGQPGTTFDPTQLIRFPVGSRTYVVIRLFFGILTPANIVGTLMSFAVALGVTIAFPGLWFCTFVALAVFAAANVLFSRMVFAWVDRWLSTRRAREVFGGLIFVFSLGIQWANFTFNPAYHHHSRSHAVTRQSIDSAQALYHHAHRFMAVLPPDLATSALLAAKRAAVVPYLGYTAACALFAAFFLLIFALRMTTEYRGENLSDVANATRKPAKTTLRPSHVTMVTKPLQDTPAMHTAGQTRFNLPGPVVAMLSKELLYIRRTMGILYGLIMPIFLVLILANRMASRTNGFWLFPAAVSYALLTIGPLSYNAFGLEGAGAQFYFLAPVRMRDILLAKNLFAFGMAFVEILAVFGIICYVASAPPLYITVSAFLYAIGTLAINMIFGNRRSITTPKKVDPQKMMKKQANQVSAFISLGIMAAAAGLAASIFALTYFMHLRWLLVPVFSVFAAGGLFAYWKSLDAVDRFSREHREEMLTELTKQS
jgi:ABC-2 type transport system permease protein